MAASTIWAIHYTRKVHGYRCMDNEVNTMSCFNKGEVNILDNVPIIIICPTLCLIIVSIKLISAGCHVQTVYIQLLH